MKNKYPNKISLSKEEQKLINDNIKYFYYYVNWKYGNQPLDIKNELVSVAVIEVSKRIKNYDPKYLFSVFCNNILDTALKNYLYRKILGYVVYKKDDIQIENQYQQKMIPKEKLINMYINNNEMNYSDNFDDIMHNKIKLESVNKKIKKLNPIEFRFLNQLVKGVGIREIRKKINDSLKDEQMKLNKFLGDKPYIQLDEYDRYRLEHEKNKISDDHIKYLYDFYKNKKFITITKTYEKIKANAGVFFKNKILNKIGDNDDNI